MESKNKHTPGEWYHVGGDDKRKAPYIRVVGDVLPGTMPVAEVCNRGSYSENLANARLIAAAKDLLEALQGMLSLDETEHQRGGGDQDVCLEVQMARAAIAKAIGSDA